VINANQNSYRGRSTLRDQRRSLLAVGGRVSLSCLALFPVIFSTHFRYGRSAREIRIFLETLMFVVACQLLLSQYASGATNDDSWHNLGGVTRDRYYTVIDRKSNCVTGHIVETTNAGVTIKLPDSTSVTIDRINVLRVSVSQAAPNFPHNLQADIDRVGDVIYNDKSSWSDLKVLAPLKRLHIEGQMVRIVRKDGHSIEGKLADISDNGLEIERLASTQNIPKADIALTYYLRYKPLSDSVKYSAQEDFWYDPRLWPYYLKLSPKIPVRLFDASIPEDDSAPQCVNSSRDH
jgi:hypothetical protein